VVRGIRPRTPLGKIAVALTAEVGGVIGDGAHRIFAAGTGGPGSHNGAEAEAAGWGHLRTSREQRARWYAAEALREQQEAGRHAEEAYRRARAEGARAQEDPRVAGVGGSGAARQSGRTYRHEGRVVADYYEVLEISPNARQALVDKAYRALMAEDHPDRGGDTARAQLLNEAYQVLRDPVGRRKYDEENGFGV
jgi:hypothetical protein